MSSRIASRILRRWGASACKTRQSQLARGHTSMSHEQRRFYTFDDDADSHPEQRRLYTPNDDDASFYPEPYSSITYDSNQPKNTPRIDPSLLATIKKQPSLPYAVGTDICHIPRIKTILEKQRGGPGYEGQLTGLWRRVLGPLEIHALSRQKISYPNYPDRTPKALAGRWAAKEAILKACYIAYPVLNKKLFMHDIVILKPSFEQTIISRSQAAPQPYRVGESALSAAMREAVEEDGEAAEVRRGPPRAYVRLPMKWSEDSPWVEVSLSISHDADYATAVALVTVDPNIELDVSTVRIPAHAREKPAFRNIRTGEWDG